MHILVTGGTGFIGGAVTRHLLSRGDQVTILARSAGKAAAAAALGARVALGDVRDPASVALAAARCEIVIHAAGVPRPASWRIFRLVHVQGTRNVIAAARAGGVRRVVHVASQAVIFSGVDLLDMQESDRYPTRFIDPYSATKAEGEQAALSENGRGGLEVTSIRPAVVWGRGDTTVLPIMARLARSPMGIPMCGDGKNFEATTHIENLVQAIVPAIAAPAAPGRAYLIGDAFRVGWKEFLARQVEAADVHPRFTRIPKSLAMPAAWMLDNAATMLALPVPLARFGLWNSMTSRIITSTRARDELGYLPRIGFAEGIADLHAWVQEIGGAAALMRGAGRGIVMQSPATISRSANASHR